MICSKFLSMNDFVKFYGSLPSNFDELKRFAQQLITIFGAKLFQLSFTEKINMLFV